jgi:hypothetical protein
VLGRTRWPRCGATGDESPVGKMRFGLHHEIHQGATQTSGNITCGVAQQNKMVIGGAERSGVEACFGGGRGVVVDVGLM